eukprot:7373020-Prymnesium_polylepis.1
MSLYALVSTLSRNPESLRVTAARIRRRFCASPEKRPCKTRRRVGTGIARVRAAARAPPGPESAGCRTRDTRSQKRSSPTEPGPGGFGRPQLQAPRVGLWGSPRWSPAPRAAAASALERFKRAKEGAGGGLAHQAVDDGVADWPSRRSRAAVVLARGRKPPSL